MFLYRFKILPLLLCLLLVQQPLRAQIHEADTLPQKTLIALQALPVQGFPYGAMVLTKIFPKRWRNNNKPADTASFPYRVSARIDTLSMFIYQDIAAPGRYTLPLQQLPAGLLPASYLSKQGLKPLSDTASLLILKLWEDKGITLYSAIIQQDIPCPACEYPPHQLVNILFTVSGNRIISRLIIAYSKGDDLERRERFCYINEQGSILIKDFLSDEINGSFLKQEEWYMTPKGFFKKGKSSR